MGDDRQFDEAHAAVTRAAATFVSEIELMFGKWEDVVAPSYLVEVALMDLSTAVSELTDEFKDTVGPATSKLLDALADYRDFAAAGPLTATSGLLASVPSTTDYGKRYPSEYPQLKMGLRPLSSRQSMAGRIGVSSRLAI